MISIKEKKIKARLLFLGQGLAFRADFFFLDKLSFLH